MGGVADIGGRQDPAPRAARSGAGRRMSGLAATVPASKRDAARAAPRGDADASPFSKQMLEFDGQALCVGRRSGDGNRPPLLLFNGIGGNIDLLSPLADVLSRRELIVFDVPGVGGSPLPRYPYRMSTIAHLGARVLTHYGHDRADVLGVSWGGGVAQEFARKNPQRCRRLILCATATGSLMVPASPAVLWKMATPRRYMDKDYARRIAGDIYGGEFRGNPGLGSTVYKNVRWQSELGYYLQIAAGLGWTSVHWLNRLSQPTLIMAGEDDPLIPLANARLMHFLIPHSTLKTFDCGHLFLLTRAKESARAIADFLDRP